LEKEVWMVTDREVRRLMELLGKGMSLVAAAAKADIDEKTARKYRSLGKLPHELRVDHLWRTREDPFDDFWAGVEENLGVNPGLEADIRRNVGRSRLSNQLKIECTLKGVLRIIPKHKSKRKNLLCSRCP
jgi:hypothetical protein